MVKNKKIKNSLLHQLVNADEKYLILLLVLITLTIFFNSLGNELFNLDDNPLVRDFIISDYSLTDLLRIDKEHPYLPVYGSNFRPIFAISFWLDFKLWFDAARGYLLTNIFFHLLNVIAIYFFSKKLFEGRENTKEISFIGALLFALHPIHTESVSWIVGRQDPMAGFFIISALIFYLNWKKWSSLFHPMAISAMFLLGLGSREVTAILLPLLFIYELSMVFTRDAASNRNAFLKLILALTLLTICMVFFSYLQEQYSSAPSQNTTGRFALIFDYFQKNTLLKIFIENIGFAGFYLAKLFFPLPLNYAIEKINIPVCAFIFFVILVIFFYSSKKNPVNQFLICGIILAILPNLAARFFNWTVVAERYLYIPSHFFCLLLAEPIYRYAGFGISGDDYKSMKWIREKRVLLLSVFLCFAASTANRNLQWQNAIGFWKNATLKSPNFGRVWNYYGGFLAQQYFLNKNEKGEHLPTKESPVGKASEEKDETIKTIEEIVRKGIELGYTKGYILLAKIARDKDSAVELKEYIKKIEDLSVNQTDDLVGIAALYQYLADNSKTKEEKKEFTLSQIEIEKKYLINKKMEEYLLLKIAKSYESISEDDEAIKLVEMLLKKKDLKLLILKGAKRLRKKIAKKNGRITLLLNTEQTVYN